MFVVTEPDGRSVGGSLPTVPPCSECHQDHCKLAAGFRECVIVTASMVAVSIGANDTALDESCEPIGEQVPTDAEIFHQFIEPVDTDGEISHDQR
jgi:hypothetical protein